jgi:uncharacterized protein (TIGR03435 family)
VTHTSFAIQVPLSTGDSDSTSVFEVATVKRSGPEPGLRRFTIQGRRFLTFHTSLADLIHFAYGLHPRQIANAPGWLESEQFDITGIPASAGQPTEKQWMGMIANLLAERFQLRFHRDTRELPIYSIVIGSGGAKLSPSSGDASSPASFGFGGIGRLVARNAGIADLAWELGSLVLDRPVVDQTGVRGRFDFTLSWTPDEFQLRGRDADSQAPGVDTPPGLFSAVQQQLGLRIEAKRGPAEVLVIDHVEMPAGN